MWEVFWQRTWQDVILLLKAPFIQPQMWWIITPLLFTFIVMTFYFGVYSKEELGWNSALGNTIVLLFVAIDLLRQIVNYTTPPSLDNFITYPVNFLIIFIVIIEALFLFRTAFTHSIPKKIMFFIASPLPVNLQAYVVCSFVYLRFQPSLYTISAAVVLFVILFITSKFVQFLQKQGIKHLHFTQAGEIKLLKKEASQLRRKAKNAKGKEKERLLEEAHDKYLESRALEKELRDSEKKEYGELVAAKKLKR